MIKKPRVSILFKTFHLVTSYSSYDEHFLDFRSHLLLFCTCPSNRIRIFFCGTPVKINLYSFRT